jgi:hypothetical protein
MIENFIDWLCSFFVEVVVPLLLEYCLIGEKRPLLIFRGTSSGKTKQTEEKKNDKNARLFFFYK